MATEGQSEEGRTGWVKPTGQKLKAPLAFELECSLVLIDQEI